MKSLSQERQIGERAIGQAIANSSCLVVILSPDANKSKWVNQELAYADNHDVKIFAILARGNKQASVPFGLAANQWVDIREKYDISLLIKAIKKYLKTGKADTAELVANTIITDKLDSSVLETDKSESSRADEPAHKGVIEKNRRLDAVTSVSDVDELTAKSSDTNEGKSAEPDNEFNPPWELILVFVLVIMIIFIVAIILNGSNKVENDASPTPNTPTITAIATDTPSSCGEPIDCLNTQEAIRAHTLEAGQTATQNFLNTQATLPDMTPTPCNEQIECLKASETARALNAEASQTIDSK